MPSSTPHSKDAAEGLFYSVRVMSGEFIALMRQKGMIQDPESRGWEMIQCAIVPVARKGLTTVVMLHLTHQPQFIERDFMW